MRLAVFLPHSSFLDEEVVKVRAESPAGHFCIEPRHLDMAASLVPGLLSYVRPGGGEGWLAVDRGLLVKKGDEVLVAVQTAVSGQLGELRREVESMQADAAERERVVRSSVAKLEAGFVRRFLDMERA